jgi:general secretion pathway protein I
VAGTQATSALTRGAQRQTDVLLAQMCAENELIKMRIVVRTTQQLPGAGDSTSTCEQANRNFTVRVEVKTTPNPNFRRIEARVLSAEPDQGAILSLATIVGRV